jgi:hypothetical protein
MKNILSMLSDGEGNTSLMRVIVLLIIGSVIASKFYNAWLTKQPVVFDTQDFELVGIAFGSKLIQNSQENSTPTATLPKP